MYSKYLLKKLLKFRRSNLLIIIGIGLFLRLFYLLQKTGNIFLPNLGGDSCYHYNVAHNIASGIGPKTSFIMSYWFYHDRIPAMTDLYGPGYHYFLSLFLLIKNEFIILRISSLLVGLSSVLVAYLLGKIIYSKKLGYVSALIICFNFFHIENSTVIMRENFNLLLVQLFFLNLFLINRNIFLFCSMGLLIGCAAMTSGSWIILLMLFFFYTFYYFKKNYQFFIKIILFLFFFLLTIFPWGYISYNYFGKILFSYLSYYPYIPDWSVLMVDIGIPDISNFWRKIDFIKYIKNHFIWGLKNLYLLHLITFPTFVFMFSFILVPASFYAGWKLKSKGFVLLIFAILYFLGLLFGSYANNGILFPRHFLVLLAPISILLGYSLILIYYYLSKFNFFKSIASFFLNYKILIYFIPILITVIGIQFKSSFWEKDSTYFFDFGGKINKITNVNDTIMYAMTPQDAWCATGRKIVHDIAFNNPKDMNRIRQEINKYDVNYLLIDLSNHIYPRGMIVKKHINQVINDYYPMLKLKEVLRDDTNGYYFYKILN